MSARLKNFNIDEFLSQYWQQSPLLMRQAIELGDLIDADELAGLAMEPDVESRLLIHDPSQDNWQLKHGPFSEADFAGLPASHWTLLVQAVDHWIPEVRALLGTFSFLPAWRIDDIMVSFATPGGGVGPHFDQYDVFLIQLSGKREWRTGQLCDENSELQESLPVKILSDFEDQESWVLEPGDVLYLPPALAHWGTAVDDCITLSIGFRAPADSEVVSDFGHFLAAQLSDFQRYSDSGISNRTQHSHQICGEDVQRLQDILTRYANDHELLSHWLGQYMTEPKYADLGVETGDWNHEQFLRHWQHHALYRNASSRMAYRNQTLYVDGQAYATTLSDKQLELICRTEEFEYSEPAFNGQKSVHQVLWALTNAGAIFFED